ncbi:tetratricopeptide (TPR) repeat protein [Pontibacter aydingkolensis]|uniref:Tetratricopeptide repeat-containing protein n=1 Tax=Pontibacter aydingkolensis TaxID=1911536 RepID=A0ABS7CR66_9BACT|nr:hypothetical protein [Pontibacter aydingkolensis]MBW7466290.1 hypothetical protein [Pontibacter aydingkolensis]
MSKKKKKAAVIKAPISDKNYLISDRARKLPVYKCLINVGWEEDGIADVYIIRQHANGHVTIGIYLVDLFCAGLKDTFYIFNIPEYDFELRMAGAPIELEECTYELAHNIIYGAIAYAQEHGIEPHPEFRITQHLLEEDTEEIPLIELEFGRNGKPFLMMRPDDPRGSYYIRQLEKYAGPGNYDVVQGLRELDDKEEDLLHPEDWEKEDWEEFIDKTEPEKLSKYLEVADFMYNKVAAKPTEAVKMLTKDKQHHSMNITYEPLKNLSYNKTPEEIEETTSFVIKFQGKKLGEKQFKEQEGRLKKSIERWPENPVFYNHLVSIYEAQGDLDKADEVIESQYRKFPDYLFAKIKYAELLMDRGQLDDIPSIFNNSYDLASIYPSRDTFHISELVNFNTMMCEYFLEKNDLYTATIYRDVLMQLDIPENVRFDMVPLFALELAIGEEMKEVLKEARQSEKKNRN